jgi:S1-C subfamily serine protease
MPPPDALTEPAPSAWPESEVGGQWEYPWGPPPEEPGPWTRPVWSEPPQWPPPSPFRSFAAICLLVVLVAAVGGAVALTVQRFTGGATPTGVNAAIVDINATLGDGNAAAGTGMILTSSGQVLTNNHVVEGAMSISAQVGGTGNVYSVTVLGADPSDDIALLQLQNASGLQTIPMGDSSRVSIGDAVTVVGNALGRGGPPVSSHGRITGLGQTITAADPGGTNAETLSDMIQFDAQIQPGDSGGPLLNASNRVIGMDTAGSSRVRFRQLGSNVGFAIPINGAVEIARQISSGQPSPNIVGGHRALIGVEVQNNNAPPGAVVIGVQSGSPAEAAGIAEQDVITSIDRAPVDSVTALRAALAHHQPGDRVLVGWVDPSGRQHTATVQLATGPTP